MRWHTGEYRARAAAHWENYRSASADWRNWFADLDRVWSDLGRSNWFAAEKQEKDLSVLIWGLKVRRGGKRRNIYINISMRKKDVQNVNKQITNLKKINGNQRDYNRRRRKMFNIISTRTLTSNWLQSGELMSARMGGWSWRRKRAPVALAYVLSSFDDRLLFRNSVVISATERMCQIKVQVIWM